MKGLSRLACCVLCMMLMATTQLAVGAVVGGPIKEADGCGFIQDASGVPISEATVKAMNGDKTVATATTLSDGSFRFTDLRNVRVDLEVSAPGFVTARNAIDRMLEADGRKCKRPVYVMLAVGHKQEG
jgi:Carboxypeptidase regulatory-like domain